jgi:rubrerythrin
METVCRKCIKPFEKTDDDNLCPICKKKELDEQEER